MEHKNGWIDISKADMQKAKEFENKLTPIFKKCYDDSVLVLKESPELQAKFLVALNNSRIMFLLNLYKDSAKNTVIKLLAILVKLEDLGALDDLNNVTNLEKVNYIG